LKEDRFNHNFNYPWIFLNEQPFTEEFIKLTTNAASSKTHYGFVNESMWGYPDWIDQVYAAQERERQSHLPYGTSESYRHMCRFQR
jgi:alpha 1,2-mannosyltransferase